MKITLLLRCLLLVTAACLLVTSFAQQPSDNIIATRKTDDGRFRLIQFDNTAQQKGTVNDTSSNNIKKILGLGFAHSFLLNRQSQKDLVEKTGVNVTIKRYDQYFKNVKVEYGTLTVQSVKGKLSLISGEYFPVNDQLSTVPGVSASVAFNNALGYIGAKKYSWEDSSFHNENVPTKPTGELVICKDFTSGKPDSAKPDMKLAYKFAIYATNPLRYDEIYVDAITGKIIHINPIIKEVNGTADTKYSGSRTIATTKTAAGNYALRDSGNGVGISTFNLKQNFDYTAAQDFIDDNNKWTATEYNNSAFDNAALDAHWGTMKTVEYWKTVHNRNSFDNLGTTLKSYIHYGNGYANAFWDGYEMNYGDGDGTTSLPFTSVDIVGHEIGHGVCQHTANLIYYNESGAMNEGFSDIWGACIKRFAAPDKNTWLCGDEISSSGTPLRSMSNPKSTNNPDTYKGLYWYAGSYDNGGVHNNSGVLNHWFYILTEGKTGTNDNGTSYAVTGIGITKAAKIAFRAESVYLFPSAVYADARIFTIKAAQDLYGANSNEALQTAAAWNAVGVYDILTVPTSLTATLGSNSIHLQWFFNTIQKIDGFVIERALDEGDNFVQIATSGPTDRTFFDSNYAAGSINKYRIRSYKGTVFSEYSNTVLVSGGPGIFIMENGKLTSCDVTFLDPGAINVYSNNNTVITTFSPADTSSKVRVSFSKFRLEWYYDYLYVYNGPNIYSPLLGAFSGSNLPPVMESSAAKGELTFVFSSNGTIVDSGWVAHLDCFKPVLEPTEFTATVDSLNTVKLKWKDNATDETKYVVERSVSDARHFSPLVNLSRNTTSYTDNSVRNNNLYYYRIKAYRDTASSKYSSSVTASIGNASFVMENANISACGITFLDPGGTGVYEPLTNFTTTFSPATAGDKLRVVFSSFRTNLYGGYLSIYDGPNQNSPFLGTFSGTTLPPVINSTSLNGELTFYFYSSSSIVDSGWEAYISCYRPVPSPTNLSAVINGKTLHLTWGDNANDETNYVVERSVNDAGHFVSIATLGINTTAYTDSTPPKNSFVYYRVKALRDTVSSFYSATANVKVGTAAYIMQNGTFTTCGDDFLDPGGESSYGNSLNIVTTLAPAVAGNKIRVDFTSFRTESFGDYLYVYDGPGTNYPSLGYFSGTTLPPVLKSSAANGELTFSFYSNSYFQDSGWHAYVSCFKPVLAPSGMTASLDSAGKVHLAWIDNSLDETKYTLERSVSDAEHFIIIKNLPANTVSFVDRSVPANSNVFYRVRALRDTSTSDYSGIVNQRIGDAPFIMQNAMLSTCKVTFLDPGGEGSYRTVGGYTATFVPAVAGNKLRCVFDQFRVNSGYLAVYDGPNASSPGLGLFEGNSLPPVLESSSATGELTFQFYNYYNNYDSGWRAQISCFKPVLAPTDLAATIINNKRVRLTWSDNANNETNYVIERSLNDLQHFVVVRTLPANITTYIDSSAPVNSIINYRIAAKNGNENSKYSNAVNVLVGNPIKIMENGTFNTCGITFLDPGGFGDYVDNSDYVTTFTPGIRGNKLKIVFNGFSLAYGDYLSIYDGLTTSSPLLGSFNEQTLPGELTSSGTSGALTFSFHSNYYSVSSGWQAYINCFKPVKAPSDLAASSDSLRKISLTWTDNADDETKYVVERSINSPSLFVPVGILPPNSTSFKETITLNDKLLFYRVRAFRDTLPSLYSMVIQLENGNAPFLMKDSTLITCNRTFMDAGGEDIIPQSAPYYSSVTFKPGIPGSRIRVQFSQFKTNGSLYVYNGSSTNSPQLGGFAGNYISPLFEGSGTEGSLTFVYYRNGVIDSGWKAQVSCYKPVAKPNGLHAAVNSADKTRLAWNDNADDEASYVVERSVNSQSDYVVIAQLKVNSTSYTDVSTPPNSEVFYRVKAIRDTASSLYSNTVEVSIGDAPLLLRDTSIVTCGKFFMDAGGTGLEPQNSYGTVTFKPSVPGNRVRVRFIDFSVGGILYVYNGSSKNSEYLGSFQGAMKPPDLDGTNPDGSITFIYYGSYYPSSGWLAYVSCYKPVAKPTALKATIESNQNVSLTWKDNAPDEAKYVVERSVDAPSLYTSIAELPPNSNSYTDTFAPANSSLYYRVIALRDSISSFYSDTAKIDKGNAPFIMNDGVITTCNKVLMDPGGVDVYPTGKYVTSTIKPAIPGNRIRISFSKFQISSAYLTVFNGSSTNDPYIGNYSWSQLPLVLEGTGPDGSLTLVFNNYQNYPDSGFVAQITCYKPVEKPTKLKVLLNAAHKAELSWQDNAVNENKYIVERSVNAPYKFVFLAQLPANSTSFTDNTTPFNSLIYYRVKGMRDTLSSFYSDTAKAIAGDAPFIMSDSTVVTCSKVFYGPGGTDVSNSYSGYTATFKSSVAGARIRVTFNKYKATGNLYVYNGSSTNSPYIGYYYLYSPPKVLEGTGQDGSLTFLYYGNYFDSGWTAQVICFKPVRPPSSLTAAVTASKKVNLKWADNSSDETRYVLERSADDTLHFAAIKQLPPNTIRYTDSTAPNNSAVFYRIMALRDSISSPYSNIASVLIGDGPLTMINGIFNTCDKAFYGPGGTGVYSNNTDYITTFTPADSLSKLKVVFTQFGTENCCDYLVIYNGPNTSSQMLGSYRGSDIPPAVTSTAPGGELTFYFHSDGSSVGNGWISRISCVSQVLKSSVLKIVTSNPKKVQLQWTDPNFTETAVLIERSIRDTLHFKTLNQLPENATSYIDNEAFNNVAVYYRIRTINTTTSSAFSNIAGFKPAGCNSVNTLVSHSASARVFISSNSAIADDSCHLFAGFKPQGSSAATGSFSAAVRVEPDPQKDFGLTFVNRHFDLLPDSNYFNGTGEVRMYITQSELDKYNLATTHAKLPVNTSDTKGIKNIRVYLCRGSSNDGTGDVNSYLTTPSEEDSAKVQMTWNTTYNCWEVRANVSGFGGFFLSSSNDTTYLDCSPSDSLGTTLFKSNLSGSSYMWQRFNGTNFVDISDDSIYAGTHTFMLGVKNNSVNSVEMFRCLVDGQPSRTFVAVKGVLYETLPPADLYVKSKNPGRVTGVHEMYRNNR